MRDIPVKIDGNFVQAAEFNSPIPYELENTVVTSGQTLNAANNFQVSQAMATYAAVAQTYIDSGSANAYALSLPSPFKAPVAYHSGMIIRFVPGNTNTGASTVNVASIGVKSIVTPQLVTLTGGELIKGVIYTLIYNGASFSLYYPPQNQQRSFVNGLTTSNNSTNPNTDIDFAIGSCTDSTNSVIIYSPTVFTKKLNATWVAGTGNGGRASAVALTPDTWYHMFVISKDFNETDFGFDTAVDASNLLTDAADYTQFRRIGSIKTNGSSNIRQFYQKKNLFIYRDRIQDFSTGSWVGGARTVITLPSVPLGIETEAQLYFALLNNNSSPSGSDVITLESMYVNDFTVVNNYKSICRITMSPAGTYDVSMSDEILINILQQVWFKIEESPVGSPSFRVLVTGWREF